MSHMIYSIVLDSELKSRQDQVTFWGGDGWGERLKLPAGRSVVFVQAHCFLSSNLTMAYLGCKFSLLLRLALPLGTFMWVPLCGRVHCAESLRVRSLARIYTSHFPIISLFKVGL